MKVIDGEPGKEAILIGLNDGSVFILSSGQRPYAILKHKAGIQSVDMDLEKRFLAIIDDLSQLTVYCMKLHTEIFSAPKVSSIVFNQSHPDLLALTMIDTRIRFVDLVQHRTIESPLSGLVLAAYRNDLLIMKPDGSIEIRTTSISVVNKSPSYSSLQTTVVKNGKRFIGETFIRQYVAILRAENRLV